MPLTGPWRKEPCVSPGVPRPAGTIPLFFKKKTKDFYGNGGQKPALSIRESCKHERVSLPHTGVGSVELRKHGEGRWPL